MKFPTVGALAIIFCGISSIAISGSSSPVQIDPGFAETFAGQRTETAPAAQAAGQAQFQLQPPYTIPSELRPSAAPEAQQVQSGGEIPERPQMNAPANN